MYKYKFAGWFEQKASMITGVKVTLQVKQGLTEHVLVRPYEIPPALAGKVKTELCRMMKEGIVQGIF